VIVFLFIDIFIYMVHFLFVCRNVEWRESASPNTSGESSETKLALADAGAGAVAEEGVEAGAEAGAGASSSSFLYLALSVLEFCVWLKF
jgi:hypothetical protein